MARAVKKETVSGSIRGTRSTRQNCFEEPGRESNEADECGTVERRVLRSKYLNFKNRISDERDDMFKVDSNKFQSIIEEADNLHKLVQKPREQVADAEVFFDITNTLVSSVKAYRNEGLTPSDFTRCLLREFGKQSGASSSHNEGANIIHWKNIGKVVSDVFRNAPGCCTMIGPMNTELKQRKHAVHQKRTRPTENERPEELDGTVTKERTDTDKNMATMFAILMRKRKVNLENLILNRNSFAQTVENLFALSFLVKDGRAEILVDATGCHLVSPRNAPAANAILSGEAVYDHFIFRFDYKDWKQMLNSTPIGDELMPHRIEADECGGGATPDSEPEETEAALPTTPIRKLCRNRGLVMQEQAVVEDSPEGDNATAAAAGAIRRGKRKLR